MVREGLKKQKKSNRIWEIIDCIRDKSNPNLLDDSRYEKDFNPFIIVRALAMDYNMTELINLANPYIGHLSKKQLYKLFLSLTPKTDVRPQWIKNLKDDNKDLDAIMEYFNCNRREAMIYFDMNDKKWLEEIKSEFGGLQS